MTCDCLQLRLTIWFWKTGTAIPTNRQIKQAGRQLCFSVEQLIAVSVWCNQFNFKVLPRNIFKGYDDSINKIADTNLTQQFHMKLPAPESLIQSTGEDMPLHLDHGFTHTWTTTHFREQCPDVRYFTWNTQLPTNTLHSGLHPGSPTLKATTLTHRSYALPIMHANYIRALHPVNYYAISM